MKVLFGAIVLTVSLLGLAATPDGNGAFAPVDELTSNSLGGEGACSAWKYLGCAGADPDEYGPWPAGCKATKCWVQRDNGNQAFNNFGGFIECTLDGSVINGCGSALLAPLPCDYRG